MPRRSAAQVVERRAEILQAAVDVASVDGLTEMSIGRLAAELGISKSGLIRHFNDKTGLQLATLQEAIELFLREVWTPAASLPSGRQRLMALCDAWLAFFERETLPGGCFMTTVSVEYDARPGPVHDAIADAMRSWLDMLATEIQAAQQTDQIDPEIDPADAAFELNALAQSANCSFQLYRDTTIFDRARRAMHRLLKP